jgi:hypothetical protein
VDWKLRLITITIGNYYNQLISEEDDADKRLSMICTVFDEKSSIEQLILLSLSAN